MNEGTIYLVHGSGRFKGKKTTTTAELAIVEMPFRHPSGDIK